MYQVMKVKIIGIAPLILHNVQMADPANAIVRAIKAITNKGTKNMTEADYEEKSRLQFLGSLYMDAEGPILPAHMIEATINAGARKSKKGVQAKSGMIVDKHSPILYDGPKAAE